MDTQHKSQNIKFYRHDVQKRCSVDKHCLIPFDRREGMTTAEASERANRTERTIRMWCRDHDIGRRIAGGPWLVSRVALAMFLNGDNLNLRAYLAGDRCGEGVIAYFAAQGLVIRTSATAVRLLKYRRWQYNSSNLVL